MARRGFTLIELVVVLAIIVLGSSFAILNLQGVTRAGRLRGAARNLASHLKFARSAAILSGKPVYVYYDLDEGTYYLTRKRYGPGRDEAPWYQLRAEEHAWRFPVGVQLAAVASPRETLERNITRFDFTPAGACVPHSVYLRSVTDDTWMTVAVNGLTGRIALYPDRRAFDGVAKELPGYRP